MDLDLWSKSWIIDLWFIKNKSSLSFTWCFQMSCSVSLLTSGVCVVCRASFRAFTHRRINIYNSSVVTGNKQNKKEKTRNVTGHSPCSVAWFPRPGAATVSSGCCSGIAAPSPPSRLWAAEWWYHGLHPEHIKDNSYRMIARLQDMWSFSLKGLLNLTQALSLSVQGVKLCSPSSDAPGWFCSDGFKSRIWVRQRKGYFKVPVQGSFHIIPNSWKEWKSRGHSRWLE